MIIFPEYEKRLSSLNSDSCSTLKNYSWFTRIYRNLQNRKKSLRNKYSFIGMIVQKLAYNYTLEGHYCIVNSSELLDLKKHT